MLVAGLATAAGAGEEALRIAVLGHVRGNADGETNRWLPEAVAALARDDPDLLVLTGDLIWGDYHAERVDRAVVEHDWEVLDQALAPLRAEVLTVPGNHDINDPTTREVFRARWGPRPTARRVGDVLLLLLDSTRIDDTIPTPSPRTTTRTTALRTAEVAWIERTLREHRDAKQVFVFLHHVLWWEPDAPWWREVHPVLTRYPVRAVFAGDFGPLKFSHTRRDGIDYLQSAISGLAHVRTARRFQSTRIMNYQLDSYLLVDVRGDEVEIAVRPVAPLSTGKTSAERFHAIFAPEDPTLRERIARALGGPMRRALLAGLVAGTAIAAGLLGYRMGRRRST